MNFVLRQHQPVIWSEWEGLKNDKLLCLNFCKENWLSNYFLHVGYWETLLQQLTTFMARARLKEFHQAMLRKKLDDLKKQVKKIIADFLLQHCYNNYDNVIIIIIIPFKVLKLCISISFNTTLLHVVCMLIDLIYTFLSFINSLY